jgi:ribonuclease T1
VVLLVALAVGYGIRAADSDTSARTSTPTTGATSTTRAAALSTLPSEVRATVRLIRRGGPFPYPHNDGVVFHNNEHRLPREPDGYYREYTVPTPGSPDRGARRLIVGRSGEYWYTSDHYESFRRVDVSR